MKAHSKGLGMSSLNSLAATSLQRLNGMGCLGTTLVLISILLIGHPLPEHRDPSAPQQTLLAADVPSQHGPLQKITLALPEQPSQTHVELAREFSEKLVAGFGLRPGLALEFSDWILEAAARQQLQPELIASLIFTESSFRKAAQSHVGAVGPAQVRPHYWGEFCGSTDLYDPEQNIYCGTQVLGYLLERCQGDQTCGLAAYNIGMNSKRRAAGLRYVAKIDRNMAQLEAVNL